MKWPGDKKFAFSLFDDTDNSTLNNVRPIYDLLTGLGIYTTKSVWPLPSPRPERAWGESLADPHYLEYVLELQARGVEIAFHGPRSGDNPRSVVKEGLDAFYELLGHHPRTASHHSVNRENLYWGAKRCNLRPLGWLARRFSERGDFEGESEGSPYFWGDLCRERIGYLRNFGYFEPNVLSKDPYMPYHDPRRPWVPAWFSSGHGLRPDNADSVFSPANLERWQRQGGLVLFSVHFGQGFDVTPNFRSGFERLARAEGWFAPVGTVLDWMVEQRGLHQLSYWQGCLLEVRFAWEMARKYLLRRRLV